MDGVLIVGAGPAGLATAACLKNKGVACRIWDRTGAAGGAFRRIYRGMSLLSPRRFVHLPYFPYPGPEEYPGIPKYAEYLEAYAAHHGIRPESAEVTMIRRTHAGFTVERASGAATDCRILVVATGLYDQPHRPRIPGANFDEASPGALRWLHARDWPGPAALAGGRLLVIGSGISGVGIAEECAAAGVRVLVSRRSRRTRLIPPRVLGIDILRFFRPIEFLPRACFGAWCSQGAHAPAYNHGYRGFVRDGRIVELPGVSRVEGRTVVCGDGTRHEVDVVVLATGYRYVTPFLPPEVARMPGGHPAARACESPSWPGLFFVGAPCARRINSEYLRGIASDALWTAERIHQQLRNRRTQVSVR